MSAADDLNKLADMLGPAVEAGLQAGGELLANEEVRQIDEIEEAEIPESSTGRPLWERTENLPKGVEVTLPGNDTAIVDVGGPAAAYAAPRDGLGVEWLPAKPAGGIVRMNQFAEDTEQVAGERAAQKVKEVIAEKLGLS